MAKLLMFPSTPASRRRASDAYWKLRKPLSKAAEHNTAVVAGKKKDKLITGD